VSNSGELGAIEFFRTFVIPPDRSVHWLPRLAGALPFFVAVSFALVRHRGRRAWIHPDIVVVRFFSQPIKSEAAGQRDGELDVPALTSAPAARYSASPAEFRLRFWPMLPQILRRPEMRTPFPLASFSRTVLAVKGSLRRQNRAPLTVPGRSDEPAEMRKGATAKRPADPCTKLGDLLDQRRQYGHSARQARPPSSNDRHFPQPKLV